MPALPKAVFSKPMSTGDSTLMLLLSLNLLLLVFFVLLNSMATAGAKHVKETLAQVSQGANHPASGESSGESLTVGGAASPAWRASVLNRLQGVVMNRIDLRVLPQDGNADGLEVDIPLDAIFDAAGRMAKPEIIRNLEAAAGTETTLRWQVRDKDIDVARQAAMLAALAAETGHAEALAVAGRALRLMVTPGPGTKADTGLQVQQVGEGAGGTVQGVEGKDGARE